METGRPSTRAVNSGSGNRAFLRFTKPSLIVSEKDMVGWCQRVRIDWRARVKGELANSGSPGGMIVKPVCLFMFRFTVLSGRFDRRKFRRRF